MEFKTKEIAQGYRRGFMVKHNSKMQRVRVWPELHDIALILDTVAGMYRGKPKQIMIVGAVEPRLNDSLHPYGGAIDIRTKDWDKEFKEKIHSLLYVMGQINNNYKFKFEDVNTLNPYWTGEHLHIQYQWLADAKAQGLPFVVGG